MSIILEKQERIGRLTINRPEVLNALDKETLKELQKIGGSAWESNPPAALLRRHTGFEVQEGHQCPIHFRLKPKAYRYLLTSNEMRGLNIDEFVKSPHCTGDHAECATGRPYELRNLFNIPFLL